MNRDKFNEKLKKYNASHKIKIRIRPDTGKFYLDYYRNYKHEIYQFDFSYSDNPSRDDHNLKVADHVRNKKEIEMLEDSTGFKLSPDNGCGTYLLEYTDSKIIFKRSAKLYRYAVERYVRFVGKNVTLDKITEHSLNQFVKRLEDEELSPITIKDYMNHIKMILNFAVEDGIIQKNPALKISLKNTEVIKVFLTVPEVETLYKTDCIRPEIKNAFLFSCFTGLRISDLLNLKWADVKEDHLLLVQQKTRLIVSQPLSKTAIKILQDQRQYKTDKYVFHLLEKNRIRKHLKAWVSEANIKKNVSFHTARHTFATMSLTAGIDIYTVSKLLGHRDLKSTQVYAKLIDKVKSEAVNKLPEL